MRSLPVIALTMALSAAVLLPSDGALADEIRKDPKGQTGISPYNEILVEGRKAVAAKNFSGAVKMFKKATESEPDNMYGYLLQAQAQLAAGDVDAARKTAETGRKKKGTEALQAKMLMFYADLEERRGNVLPPGHTDAKGVKQTPKDVWDTIKETWSAYAVFLTAHASLPDYKATADERKKQIAARVERDASYAEVRKRMAAEVKTPAK